MSLPLLERVADSKLLLSVAVIVGVVSETVMIRLWLDLQGLTNASGPPPDLRFGYTVQDLNAWYESLGEEGCLVYRNFYRWDLFPFMQSYAILFGALLFRVARQAHAPTDLALLFPLAMIFDVIETMIPARGCEMYPHQRLPDYLIVVASVANQIKWISFAVGAVLLLALFFHNNFWKQQQVATQAKPTQQKTE